MPLSDINNPICIVHIGNDSMATGSKTGCFIVGDVLLITVKSVVTPSSVATLFTVVQGIPKGRSPFWHTILR